MSVLILIVREFSLWLLFCHVCFTFSFVCLLLKFYLFPLHMLTPFLVSKKIVGFSISFLQKLPIKSLENRGRFMFEMKEKSCRHEMLRHNHSSRGLPYDGSQSIRVSCRPFLSPLSNMLQKFCLITKNTHWPRNMQLKTMNNDYVVAGIQQQ